MGRRATSNNYNHRVSREGFDRYTLSWCYRPQQPASRQRATGAASAMRFCNKHGLSYPPGLENDLAALWQRDQENLRWRREQAQLAKK